MTKIFPAIDIINGQCVRLIEGALNQKTIYEVSPLEMALKYESLGAKNLHIIDLDAAFGNANNLVLISQIVKESNLYIQVGGGVRTANDISNLLEIGVNQVIVGSRAVSVKKEVKSWLKLFGEESIVIGADTLNNKIMINGWKEESGDLLTDFIQEYQDAGAIKFLSTDISKDGKLQGASSEMYKQLQSKFPKSKFLVSGGVSDLQEVEQFVETDVYGIVIGKAIFENRIDPEKLFKLC